MPPRTRLAPCARCRERHLKCDPEHPCTNCRTVQVSCEKARKKKIRFKHVFAPNRSVSTPAAGDKGALESSPLDPARVPRTASVSSPPSNGQTQTLDFSRASDGHDAQNAPRSHHSSINSGFDDVNQGHSVLRHPDVECLGIRRESGTDSNVATCSESFSPHIIEPSPNRIEQNESSYWSRPQAGTKEQRSEEPCEDIQIACMIRCFVEKLAPAFDTTDPNRHYADIVPLRAKKNPLLLNAICTASARYLCQLNSQSNQPGIIEYNGVKLSNLSEKSAALYHNICISYLKEMTNDPTALQSGDVLIAITILRFHEQVDTHFTKLDQEIYTRVTQTVFRTQNGDRVEPGTVFPTQFGTASEIDFEPSLKLYASLVALKQEIWSVLLYQRPFRLPISTKDLTKVFDADSQYTMFQWADHCVEWCGQVLKFCFPDDPEIDGCYPDEASRIQRWESLRSFEQKWKQEMPECLRPIYFEERNPDQGRYLPRIWHIHDCQVMAWQHLEFGKIALVAHNPNLPRIGLGARAGRRAQEKAFLESTRTICGLAMSNPKSQPAMVTAAVSISMSGEYFKDPGEQSAILELLRTLQREHAWPTAHLIQTLRASWELEDANRTCR